VYPKTGKRPSKTRNSDKKCKKTAHIASIWGKKNTGNGFGCQGSTVGRWISSCSEVP
jgi:hypothetical protein